MADRPLAGLRIITVSQYGAGPFASLHFADLGAEVIKVEDWDAGGDMSRYVPPYEQDADSLFFQSLNRSKRSICVNLREPAGHEVLRDLVAHSDVVFSNLRGDRPAKLGLTYDALKDANPMIVCCSLSGYGVNGPRAGDPAFDYLIQAETGIVSMTGEPDGAGTRCGVSIVDFSAGYAASFAIAAGVLSAHLRGVGCDIDVSLYEVATAMLNYLATWHLSRGFEPARLPGSAHPSLVPSQLFATADGALMVMCNKEIFYVTLCERLGRTDLAADPRFTNASARLEHRDALVAELSGIFAAATTDEWIARLGGSVPVAKVHTIGEALRSEIVESRGLIVDVEHPGFGVLHEIGTPFRFAGDEPTYTAAPALGADTASLLTSLLDYDDERIQRLRDVGAIGPVDGQHVPPLRPAEGHADAH